MTVEIGADVPTERIPLPGLPATLRARLDGVLRLEILRFGLVGVANTGIDLGLYFLLQASGSPVLLANLISTTAGLTFSFVANRLFTFRARPAGGSAVRQMLLFLVCTGIGLWVVQPLVLVGMGRLLEGFATLGDLRILIAKLAAIAIGMVWNWTLYNKVVFRTRKG
jgi:putative flippase GtrA